MRRCCEDAWEGKGLAEVVLCKGNDKGKQGTRCSVTVVVTSFCFQTNPANVRAKLEKNGAWWRHVMNSIN